MTVTKVHDCAEAVRWLPCPCPEGTMHGDWECQPIYAEFLHHKDCPCDGTGLRFPDLSEACVPCSLIEVQEAVCRAAGVHEEESYDDSNSD